MTGGGQKIRIKNVSSLRIKAFGRRKRGEKSPQCFVISPHILTKRRGVCVQTRNHRKKLRDTPTQGGVTLLKWAIQSCIPVFRRVTKEGHRAKEKSMKLKHLNKTSARKEEKSSLEFEKLHTFAAQRDAKHTKTPPRPLHLP